MDDISTAIQRLDKRIEDERRDTRKNYDKLFAYIARLEVSTGKLVVHIETLENNTEALKEQYTNSIDGHSETNQKLAVIESQLIDVKSCMENGSKEFSSLRDRIRRIELLFVPAVAALTAAIGALKTKLGY